MPPTTGAFFGLPEPSAPRPVAAPTPLVVGGTPAAPTPAPGMGRPGGAGRPAQADPAADQGPVIPHLTIAGATPTLDDMLRWVHQVDASDLHLAADVPPKARLHGTLRQIPGSGTIPARALEHMLYGIMNDRQRSQFEETGDLDMAYALGEHARFRVNVLRSRGKVASVMRLIPTRVKTCDELGVSPHLRHLMTLSQGLIVITGPTGSGKSTLMAALVDDANKTRSDHILTIEDPIEFTHRSQLATVTQREVHEDTRSFATALRAALREDPDIILVGEMRDQETTQAAIEAADTGHLVLGSLHTRSAPETITRIVNIFPAELQAQIQTTLASSLQAVVTQTLVKTVDGTGRAPAQEVMILDDGIRNQIRAGKLEQIASALQTGAERGMHTMSHDLARLVREGRITEREGAEKAPDQNEFFAKLGRGAVPR